MGSSSSDDYKCWCVGGYVGEDCSRRECPFGMDQETGIVSACSGRGSCSSKTGRCSCLWGFAGNNCEKCSIAGHFKCVGKSDNKGNQTAPPLEEVPKDEPC